MKIIQKLILLIIYIKIKVKKLIICEIIKFKLIR